jgi:antitoxin FitA
MRALVAYHLAEGGYGQAQEVIEARTGVTPGGTGFLGIAFWRRWRHNGAMPSVQIKDVPERTHAVLRQRAAAAHQSLQEYLRARLIEEAEQPTLQEVLDRAGGRSGGSVPLQDAVAAIRDDRAGR